LLTIATLGKLSAVPAVAAAAPAEPTAAQKIELLRAQVDMLTQELGKQVDLAAKKRGRIAAPKKYNGGRDGLKPFLTHIDLYCQYNNLAADTDKILAAGMHTKGKAATWIQPIIDDYLEHEDDPEDRRDNTNNVFKS
jgi:hypothetical protein